MFLHLTIPINEARSTEQHNCTCLPAMQFPYDAETFAVSILTVEELAIYPGDGECPSDIYTKLHGITPQNNANYNSNPDLYKSCTRTI